MCQARYFYFYLVSGSVHDAFVYMEQMLEGIDWKLWSKKIRGGTFGTGRSMFHVI